MRRCDPGARPEVRRHTIPRPRTPHEYSEYDHLRRDTLNIASELPYERDRNVTEHPGSE